MRLPWTTSDLHPHALSVLDVADDATFASDLAADMAAFSPPDIIHRYRCVLEADAHTATLKACGFHAVRMTRMIDLPLSVLDHPTLQGDFPEHIAPHWFLPNERAPWPQWLDAHWQHYAATHASNPPALPATGLRDIFIGDDLIEALALREGPQGRVRAFASLRKGEDIGWIAGPPDLLPLTLAATLRRAAALGWSKARVEVDDDDGALWSLLDTLGVAPAQTFITWQRERNPAKRPS